MTHDRDSGTSPLRVMQSYSILRSTTNPYLHMLDAALRATDGIELVPFNRQQALRGQYDVLHLHWPETMLGGRTPLRAFARRLIATGIVWQMGRGNKAIVRTAHNVELPEDVTAWERTLLRNVEREADLRILLNELTEVDGASVVIPHGHYRDWFSAVPRLEPAANTLAFVGLVRRYKGVEHLIETFGATRETHPDLRLSISGNPTSETLRAEVDALAATDHRVSTDLRFLSEDDFATAVLGARGLVLPYRFMHNSGTALAALSLDRPVLVPRNAVNEALAHEVGGGWVHMYDGDLTSEALMTFAAAIESPPSESPRLERRDWHAVGAEHRRAYELAIERRKARRARR